MQTLSGKEQAILSAVARRVVPGLAGADAATAERFLEIIDDALLARPAAVRRQVGAFLGLISRLPIVRYGRGFEGLNAARQDAVLGWLQECPVSLFQKGFWGLKSLIFMGWFGQVELWPELGYEPITHGNERLDG
jgi:hypothetical protein